MAKSKKKASKKASPKKSAQPVKNKKSAPAKKAIVKKPAPKVQPKKVLITDAEVVMPPPPGPASYSDTPYPSLGKSPIAASAPAPATVPAVTGASPIASAAKPVEEKKPKIIRITEAIAIPQLDTLANRPAAPFAQNPRAGGAPHPVKAPTGVSDLKTLVGTVKHVCKNHRSFRALAQTDIQDLVKKTHPDVKVTLDKRHVTLTQGSATEEFDY